MYFTLVSMHIWIMFTSFLFEATVFLEIALKLPSEDLDLKIQLSAPFDFVVVSLSH